MKRALITIASLLMFVIVATAQARDTDPRVSPIASPISLPMNTIQAAPIAPILPVAPMVRYVLRAVPMTAEDWLWFKK